MKNTFFAIAIGTITLAACYNSSNKLNEINKINNESTKANVATSQLKSSSPVGEILADYLQMKNAFANDNDKEAAAAGNKMVKSFENFDEASLTADKKKIFNDIRDDAKENAEHIGMNAGNIKHQREHFDMLSKDMYDLVKAFGAGRTLYQDYCPMYNDNKGATWLSETKEIKNPYLGKDMDTCGSVKEELK
ncbi:DUF3347 domain-containing protein [Hanamia caeni]|jgi:hypothetical protein|uniref:DUF3347 domain-containing protein n=1 Tax=Hanamia caeni TaxID=2294116 RepID=A0A3M9NRV9_9BACT|nr:DUF3347 domain-containing protein [Hanamia caeni]RNI39778.1 DUF3347 domain-containing protein [Hanamia caeni]